MSNHIYTPTCSPLAWKALLADPDKQWRKEYSARTMAFCWEDANGFPMEINDALKNTGLKLKIVLAIPEFKVQLDTGKAPSQNDLFVLAERDNELFVIMIEGKVSEPFDKVVNDWNNDTPSRVGRLNFLIDILEISGGIDSVNKLRYQLLHRTASAIIIAKKFNAKGAIMIVNSFSQTHEWFDDYSEFVSVLSQNKVAAKLEEVSNVKVLNSGIELYTGWVTGNEKYLNY